MRLIAAGDRALLVRTGASLSPGAYRRALRLWQALVAARLPGVVDLVLAYASVLVHFDPLITDTSPLSEHIRAVYARMSRARMTPGRLVTIPVRYGGADGPDLEDVAAYTSLTPNEVIRQHARPVYRVYFLGFTAGFPYLGGLPAALTTPRLDAPRTRVLSGSVGIAGQQTGIYPAASPGGWRLIGRTTTRLFDPARTSPALLRPGDRVRFVPVAGLPANKFVSMGRAAAKFACADSKEALSSTEASDAPPGVPWLRVIQPGSLTTVQDLGRPGYAAEGVAAGGAVDRDALRLGNLLLGNMPGAAALEITVGSAAFEALAPCAITVTGADCVVRVAGRPVARHSVALVPAGARIELDRWRHGARAYLCVAGGVAVPLVLGSRATDLRAEMGGLAGRALRPGDEARRGETTGGLAARVGRRLPSNIERGGLDTGEAALQVLPGPHAAAFPGDLAALLASTYRVDPRADRMGARLIPAQGEPVAMGGEVLSEGVPHGAIQVPPDGQPILLLAGHQTTGGYRIPAVVASADLWRAAQLRPGDLVRFTLTSTEEALAVLRAREDWYAWAEARLARAYSERDDLGPLMGGFAEWSEEPDDDE